MQVEENHGYILRVSYDDWVKQYSSSKSTTLAS